MLIPHIVGQRFFTDHHGPDWSKSLLRKGDLWHNPIEGEPEGTAGLAYKVPSLRLN